MQLEMAFVERVTPPTARSKSPWEQINSQAQIAVLEILSRLIARMLAAKAPEVSENE